MARTYEGGLDRRVRLSCKSYKLESHARSGRTLAHASFLPLPKWLHLHRKADTPPTRLFLGAHKGTTPVAVQMIRDILRLLRVGLDQRNQAAVMTRRARTRRELPRSEAP
jgi:hypothetical protein